jgi:uncharacterized protein YjiS (DUF1127 family)
MSVLSHCSCSQFLLIGNHLVAAADHVLTIGNRWENIMSNFRRQSANLNADDLSIATKASIAEDCGTAEQPRSTLGGLTLYLIDSFALGAASFYGGHPIEFPDNSKRSGSSVLCRERREAQASPRRRLARRALSGISASIQRLCVRIARERAISRSIVELSKMDDRILRDIGLTRDQISGMARHSRTDMRWD